MALAAIRKRLAITATVALAGVVLSTTFDQTLGGLVTVGGVVALVITLHRFGRTGPD